jgi:hypothetical protein
MAGNFALDISRFVNRSHSNVDTVTRKIVFDIMRSVVRKSPVDTGRFKGNWQYGNGEMPTRVTAIHDVDGRGTEVHMMGQVPQEASGKLHYIVNNLPYSIALENGHSPQCPPNGMVGLTISEYQGIVRRAAREVNP